MAKQTRVSQARVRRRCVLETAVAVGLVLGMADGSTFGVGRHALAQVPPSTMKAVAPSNAPATEPSTRPLTPEEMREEDRKSFVDELRDPSNAATSGEPGAAATANGAALTTTHELPPMFVLHVHERLVHLSSPLKETNGFEVFGLADKPGNDHGLMGKFSVLRNEKEAPPAPGEATEPTSFTVIAARFDDPEVLMRRIDLSSLRGIGHLSLTYTEKSAQLLVSANLIQHPTEDTSDFPVRLYVTFMNTTSEEQTGVLRLSAESVADLAEKYPTEVARYVRPALELLGHGSDLFAADERLAGQVLAVQGAVDAGVVAQLKTLLPKLEAQSFAEREAAHQELRKLGSPAALALRSWERASLSAQQNAEIDAFLTEFKALPNESLDAYRHNADFLLDVLLTDNDALRDAAWKQLQRIEPSLAAERLKADAPGRIAQAALLRGKWFRATSDVPKAAREPSDGNAGDAPRDKPLP